MPTRVFDYTIVSSDADYIAEKQALYPNGFPFGPFTAKAYTGFQIVGIDTFTRDATPYITQPSGGMGFGGGGDWVSILSAAGVEGIAVGAAPYDAGTPTITAVALWFCATRINGNPVDSGTAVLIRSDTAVTLDPDDSNILWGFQDHSGFDYSFAGFFLVQGGATVPPTSEAVQQRRWIEGFEVPDPDSASGGLVPTLSRDASRTPEGIGLAIRDQAQTYTRTVNAYLAGNHGGSWERLYVRLRTAPTSNYDFWRVFNSSNPSASGGAIRISPAGDLLCYNVNSSSTFSLLGTAAGFFPINEWVRLDILVQFDDGTHGASLRIFRNGELELDIPSGSIGSVGLGLQGFHSTTQLGNTTSGRGIELDVDDWINAEIPTLFTGVDWLNGSHCILVRPNGFDSSHSSDWTGDWRTALSNPGFEATDALSSSTASARMALTTDAEYRSDLGWFQQGVAAFLVSIFSTNSGGNDGQLGYAIDGGADVLETINELNTFSSRGVLYNPSGMVTPDPITPLVLLHTKSTGTSTGQVRFLVAQVEALGIFGVGDLPADVEPLPDLGIHNAPYVDPAGPWSSDVGFPPGGSVGIEAGTYTGDDLGQDIVLNAPPHWIYIRPITPASGMPFWFSSMIGTHGGFGVFDIVQNLMPQVVVESDGTIHMRIAGDDTRNNASGRTYQYVCFSDAGMRFLLNGAFRRSNSLVAATNPLVDSTFFPEAAFLQRENLSVGTTVGAYYRGKGHTTAQVSPLNTSTIVNNALSFSLGALLSQQTPFHGNSETVAYSVWRVFDGPGSPGGPGTSGCDPDDPDPGRAVAITTYIGNGSSPRTIDVELNGHRPLLAIVIPHNAAAIVRDPSHTGTTSTIWASGTADASNGIVGGDVDEITVGSNLNQSGIIYEVFVLPGDEGGSGWGTNSFFIPVPPAAPCGPWPPNNPEPPPTPPSAGAACELDFPTDLT